MLIWFFIVMFAYDIANFSEERHIQLTVNSFILDEVWLKNR